MFFIIRFLSFLIRVLNFTQRKWDFNFYDFPVKKIMLLKENLIFNIASKLLQSHFKHDANAIAVWSDSGSYNNVVWSVWLQGENEASDLVKRCFDSIRKNHSQELKVIDLENLNQYLIINPKILDKYKSGIISNTSFSEIIRLELLSNYGGLWVDSTIFCYKPMPNLFESNLSFLTLKGKASYTEGDPLGAIPVFFIFCHSGYNPIIKTRDLLNKYWLSYKNNLDYFLIDYFLKFIFQNDKEFKKDFECLPTLGNDRFLLNEIMNMEYSEVRVTQLDNSGCCYFKLSNKSTYHNLTSTNLKTVYSVFIEEGFYGS